MPRYRVEWTQTIRGSIEVEADDEGHAEEIAQDQTDTILDGADYEFEVDSVDLCAPDGCDEAKKGREV